MGRKGTRFVVKIEGITGQVRSLLSTTPLTLSSHIWLAEGRSSPTAPPQCAKHSAPSLALLDPEQKWKYLACQERLTNKWWTAFSSPWRHFHAREQSLCRTWQSGDSKGTHLLQVISHVGITQCCPASLGSPLWVEEFNSGRSGLTRFVTNQCLLVLSVRALVTCPVSQMALL